MLVGEVGWRDSRTKSVENFRAAEDRDLSHRPVRQHGDPRDDDALDPGLPSFHRILGRLPLLPPLKRGARNSTHASVLTLTEAV